ncbi:unnamed protein product [Brassicogethes aeneus]|uniref:Peroxin-19 n=1 Tax=Brassicogethes aeneus TaxID=1431903 RepID=A0A9P0AU40_BRAAE|nr:unnamed protein product [Brassicogethes aeneus]
MSDKKDEKVENVDKELSDLLDSALEDFTTTKDEPKKDSKEIGTTSNTENNVPEQWTEDFIQQAASQFEANFSNLLAGGDPNAQVTPEFIQQKLQQMAEAAQQVLENPAQVNETTTDFGQSISQAIQGLNQGAEGLQNPFSEDDLMKIFGNPEGGTNDLLPFMQGMMQGLLSKEVLGPSLKDFVARLPEYLEKNKDTISAEDKERYLNQKKLMEEVLQELDKEEESQNAEEKKETFSKVLALMQKLQDYGQPPSELVGDVETPFNFDPSGNPTAPPQDCCIM